jgi:hypothetical protein
MVLRLPTSGGPIDRQLLSQAHQLGFDGLRNEAAAPPPADHPAISSTNCSGRII